MKPENVAVFEDSLKGYEAVVRAGCNLLRVANPSEIRAENVLKRILSLEATSMIDPQVNIVIPMAGEHPEFWMQGPDMPSVQIPVNLSKVRGRSGLYWTLHSLEPLPARVRFIFIVGSDFRDNAALTRCLIWATKFQRTSIFSLTTPTSGAAMTVLQARHLIQKTSPLVIFDGNHSVIWGHPYGVCGMLANMNKAHASIATFRDHDVRWSYVQLMPGSNTQVVAVKRKVAMSDMACSGLFCFREGCCFLEAAEETMLNFASSNAHIASVLDHMVMKGKHVDACLVAGSSSIRLVSEVKQFAENLYSREGLSEQIEIYSEMRTRNERNMRNGFVHDANLKEIDDCRRCLAVYVMADASNLVCFATLQKVLYELGQSFSGHVLYRYDESKDMQNALSGGLHWTFLQLIGFNMFTKINIPTDFKKVVQRLVTEHLRQFEIRFTSIVATPSNLLLVGYPTSDCNNARCEIRQRLRLLGLPLYEPYNNDIFHMTLLRFAEPLSEVQQHAITRFVADTGLVKDQTLALLRVKEMCISNSSWKMQQRELEREEVVTVCLSA